jgi:dTDP-4-dehydrorhamnose reductase
LVEVLTARGETVIGVGRDTLDMTDFAACIAFVTAAQPDIVIHAAAWTDVDGCARDPEKALQINGLGAQNIALAAARVDAPILYVSTNEVFDGAASVPYREYDTARPINPYGYSKYVGERAITMLHPRHYIVRTSWVFAHGGKNFIQTMLNAAAAGKSLRVVIDEIASPTYNDDLADGIAALITTGRYGLYHLTNAGACSRYAFARAILDRAGYRETPIQPLLSHQWARPSTPPHYTPLANLAGASIGITMRTWESALDAFLEKEGLARVESESGC